MSETDDRLTLEREHDLPILIRHMVKAAETEEEIPGPEITTSTLVLVTRYLQGWHGLFINEKGDTPRLTTEGAFRLYLNWKTLEAE